MVFCRTRIKINNDDSNSIDGVIEYCCKKQNFISLGSCTSMTLGMYADRKGWPLEGVTVRLRHSKIHARDCADCDTRVGKVDEIQMTVALEGPLVSEQRDRLMEIAGKCPVHRTLQGEIKIRTAVFELDG